MSNISNLLILMLLSKKINLKYNKNKNLLWLINNNLKQDKISDIEKLKNQKSFKFYILVLFLI